MTARIRVNLPVAAGSGVQDVGAPFAVNARTVTLKSRVPGDMGSGDCELLEQIRDRLLPKLKMQVVKDDLMCIPGRSSPAVYTLQVAALAPVKEST